MGVSNNWWRENSKQSTEHDVNLLFLLKLKNDNKRNNNLVDYGFRIAFDQSATIWVGIIWSPHNVIPDAKPNTVISEMYTSIRQQESFAIASFLAKQPCLTSDLLSRTPRPTREKLVVIVGCGRDCYIFSQQLFYCSTLFKPSFFVTPKKGRPASKVVGSVERQRKRGLALLSDFDRNHRLVDQPQKSPEKSTFQGLSRYYIYLLCVAFSQITHNRHSIKRNYRWHSFTVKGSVSRFN